MRKPIDKLQERLREIHQKRPVIEQKHLLREAMLELDDYMKREHGEGLMDWQDRVSEYKPEERMAR